MKKIIFATLSLAVIAGACKKGLEDKSSIEKPIVVGPTVDTLVGEITANATLTKSTNYLKGIVYVKPGVTLTIPAGTTIIGSPGGVAPDTVNLANNKGTLVVQQGAKLIANGTPTSPIVWTSSKAPGSRKWGDWGGVVLLGKAPIHTATGGTTNTFEALPASDPRNTYGGTDSADNSGSITYNRFEFGGGVVIKPNQEVNGFTFCGVGAGTTFHHVEVTNSGDDGFEWFGGTVNCHHLIDFSPKDDEYDFDEGFRGSLQYIIAYRLCVNDNSGSHCIETDNDANATSTNPRTRAFISNATFIGPADTASCTADGNINYYDGEIFIRRNSRLILVNSLIIAQKQKWALVTTPTTTSLVGTVPALSDSILIGYNIWQTNSADPIVKSSKEGNPATVVSDPATLAKLTSPGLPNTALATLADFKLDGFLKPLPGSPALSGGVNLASLGLPFFTGTTQRGAVTSSDPWTSTGTWISIATN